MVCDVDMLVTDVVVVVVMVKKKKSPCGDLLLSCWCCWMQQDRIVWLLAGTACVTHLAMI